MRHDTAPCATSMPTFLVERYVPADRDLRDAVMRAVRVAAELDRPEAPVRYLWSARIAADETWLCCFEAPDAGVVADLNRRAAFPFDRISEADVVWTTAPTQPAGGPPMNRRSIALVVPLAAVLTLAACTGGSSPAPATSGPPASATQPASAKPAPAGERPRGHRGTVCAAGRGRAGGPLRSPDRGRGRDTRARCCTRRRRRRSGTHPDVLLHVGCGDLERDDPGLPRGDRPARLRVWFRG